MNCLHTRRGYNNCKDAKSSAIIFSDIELICWPLVKNSYLIERKNTDIYHKEITQVSIKIITAYNFLIYNNSKNKI